MLILSSHQGYVQFDVDLEDNFGKAGKTARKKKVAKEKQYKHLSGNEARVLYLVCLQIILRKQIAWLVRNKGFGRELESVCRGLWDLRIRKFIGLGAAAGKKPEKGKEKNAASHGSDGELVMYSSQAETQAATTDEEEGFGTRPKRMSRVKNWSSENWDLPGAMDTLAVVYLGCLLRKETVRIGDVFRWAQNDQLPFLGAVSCLWYGWDSRWTLLTVCVYSLTWCRPNCESDYPAGATDLYSPDMPLSRAASFTRWSGL